MTAALQHVHVKMTPELLQCIKQHHQTKILF